MFTDLDSGLEAKRLIDPASTSDNTAVVSQIIDLQGYLGAEIVLVLGSLADADATFAVKLEESANSDMSSATDVTSDATKIIGTAASFTFASDNTVQQFGYKGAARYLRVTITPSANSSAALIAGVALLKSRKIGSGPTGS